MSKPEVLVRAGHARAFLAAAQLVDELGEDADIGPTGNIIGSLSVLAAIAASDAICGHSLGLRAAGDDHGDAVKLLATTGPRGREQALRLATLVEAKSNTQYNPLNLTAARAAVLLKAAGRLVDGMQVELAAT